MIRTPSLSYTGTPSLGTKSVTVQTEPLWAVELAPVTTPAAGYIGADINVQGLSPCLTIAFLARPIATEVHI